VNNISKKELMSLMARVSAATHTEIINWVQSLDTPAE
jgi:hypothetical protein